MQAFIANYFALEEITSFVSCTKSATANLASPWDSQFWTVLSRCFRPLTSVGFWVYFRLFPPHSKTYYFFHYKLYGQHWQVLFVILMFVVWANEGQIFFCFFMRNVLLNCNEFQQMDDDSSALQMMSDVWSNMFFVCSLAHLFLMFLMVQLIVAIHLFYPYEYAANPNQQNIFNICCLITVL